MSVCKEIWHQSDKIFGINCDFNFSNQITDADEACLSSEISVDLIIIAE
jgi:hypothetical protein